MRFCLLLLALGSFASAQTPYLPFPQLRQYLQLTDSQMQTLAANNDAFNRFLTERQLRLAQVRLEIAEWTAKDVLDPAALGIRYAEIEATCRQIRAESLGVQAKNLSVLDESQKGKLTALTNLLDQFAKLSPVVTEGQAIGLLAPPSGSLAFPYVSLRLGAPVMMGVSEFPFSTALSLTGCQQPAGAVIRADYPRGAALANEGQ